MEETVDSKTETAVQTEKKEAQTADPKPQEQLPTSSLETRQDLLQSREIQREEAEPHASPLPKEDQKNGVSWYCSYPQNSPN
jgi:hypothetical protein